MSPREKILKFVAESGMNDSEFCELAGVATSFMTRLRQKKYNVTLTQGRRVKKAMKVTLDYLYDETLGWPPPRLEDVGITLSRAERTVLDLAHEVSRRWGNEDLALEPARLRLLGLDPYPVIAGAPGEEEPAEPTRAAYGDRGKVAVGTAGKAGKGA